MKTPKAAPTFLRSSFTEKLVFPSKPSAAVRKALRDSGWKWNSVAWFRNTNTTAPITAKQLEALLIPSAADSTAGEVAAN